MVFQIEKQEKKRNDDSSFAAKKGNSKTDPSAKAKYPKERLVWFALPDPGLSNPCDKCSTY